jgi:predicted Zn-dependent protease
MGDLEAAREALARAVELAPGQLLPTRQLADLTYQLYFRDPGRPMTLLREVEALGERLRKQWPMAPDGYRILAQVLMERHRTDEAAELLQAAARTLTNNEVLRAQLSAALLRLGRSEESEKLLEELIAERPQYAEAYDLLYLQRMRAGHTEAARAVLAAKWAKMQTLDAALQLAAHEDANAGPAGALKVFAAAGDVVERTPLGYARAGDFWLQRGDFGAAQKAYQAGLRQQEKGRADYVGRMAEWHLARNELGAAQRLIDEELARYRGHPLLEAYAAALRLGEAPAARRVELRQRLEAILQQMPDSPFVRYHLGRAYLLENNPQVALESFEQSVKLDPNYAPGWLALAELELARGNAAGAESRAGALLARYPSHMKALLLNAQAQMARGRFAEATSVLRQLLRHNPDNLDAQYLLGLNDARQEKYADAAVALRRGQAVEPQNPRWLLALAALEARQGKPEKALEMLEVNKGKDPQLLARYAYLQLELRDGAGARKSFEQLAQAAGENVEVKLGLAAAEALAGDIAGALERYRRLRETNPNEVRAHLQAAALLDEQGKAEEALALYESALQLDPNQPVVLNNLAWLLLKAKTNPQRALELAQRAKRITRQSAEVDGTLAQAFAATGLHRNALAVYEEMLSYVPPAERPRIQQLLAATRQRVTPEKRS